jgi:hypothetical protein
MKLFKLGLRLWMTLVSVFSFLLGWIFLAHAQKPAQPKSSSPAGSATPLPTLVPLSPLNIPAPFMATNQPLTLQAAPTLQPAPTQDTSFFAPQPPVFSTGGS